MMMGAVECFHSCVGCLDRGFVCAVWRISMKYVLCMCVVHLWQLFVNFSELWFVLGLWVGVGQISECVHCVLPAR